MSNIFFTSDTHAYHRNIAGPKVSQWKSGYRDFNDEYEMTAEIIKQINNTVDKDDTLYHLGDWSFGGIDKIWYFRKQINCKNIHLILGNHDHHIEHNKKLTNCWIRYNSGKIVDTEDSTSDWDENPKAKQLFSSVQHVKSVTIGKHKFFLSHFAHRVWDKSHHGIIHLYGHSHNSIDNNWGKSMDCGVDAAREILGAYRPFSLQEIIDIMDKREIKVLDHHNSSTNI